MFRFKIFVLFLLLTSCSGDKDSLNLNQPSLVTTVVVSGKNVPIYKEYVAQTQSSHLVNIQARVNGFLEKRVYTEGEMVKKGQVLFVMDEKPFQAQVDAARAALARQEAALETARLNLARVKPLSELNALSQKDLDDATGQFQTMSASVEQAKAELLTADLNLSYCTISSPIDGVTSSALQQEGAYLTVGDSQLTTVSALNPMWVNFSLSENEIQDYRDEIQRGALVPPRNGEYDVKIIQVNGKFFPYTGKITFTEPYFNPQTGTFLIRVSVDNPNNILRPNQFVRVRVEGAFRPRAILVPQRAVQQSTKGHYVWVVNHERKVEMRPIVVGDWLDGNWFINEGLVPGDEIVVDGVVMLHPGDLVKVKSESN